MPRSDHSAFLTGSPFVRLSWLGLAVLLGAFALGCTPKIGDGCTQSTNCSSAGDRLCDTTQPGGYCTVFNCEPGSCPADSVCINFGTTLAGSLDCAPSQGNSPHQRSFCMATCAGDGDCRADYRCLNLKGPDQDGNRSPESLLLGAVLVEHSGDGKVCGIAPKEAVGPDGAQASTDVCDVARGGAPSSGGSSSVGGSSGSGGSSAAGAGGAAGASGAAGDTGASGAAGAGG